MKLIKKLRLKNFKKFESFEVEFDDEINIIIGDNEAGKSTILSAIDLVLSGSRHKIESIGLENMFNEKISNDYLTSSREYLNLPELYIEVYLNEQNNDKTFGRNNSKKNECDGLRLRITPNDEYSKNILVEGDAEFLLIDKFSQIINGDNLHKLDINVLSVDGTSFSHYLEIAKLLKIKTCVITDNDKRNESEMIIRFENYKLDNISIYYDKNPIRSTFEICIYNDNILLCDKLFKTPSRRLPIQEYMLKNKTDSAYKLLGDDSSINIPNYIVDALKWINQ